MKKLLPFILAGFLSTGAIESLAIGHKDIPKQIETPDDPPSSNKIDLHGLLDCGVGSNSVEAYYGNSCVTVFFHKNFGYVNITLMSESGSVVYNNTVNTSVQQTFYIPLSGTSSGNYTLILDNANGYAEGEFAR